MGDRIVLGAEDFADEPQRPADPGPREAPAPEPAPAADRWTGAPASPPLAVAPLAVAAPVVAPPRVTSSWPPLASVGARFVGQLLDTLIVFGLAILAGFLGIVLGSAGLLAMFVLLLFPLFGVSLVAARTGKGNGQSWGQQLAGVRVLRRDGQPLGFATALLRNLCRMVPLYWLWIFLNPERQGLHDLLAHTIVVSAEVASAGPVAGPPPLGPPLGAPPPGPTPLAGPPPR